MSETGTHSANLPNPPSRSKLEWGVLGALGVLSLCSFALVMVSLATPEAHWSEMLVGLGPLVAGVSTMGLLWFRNRNRSVSSTLIAALASWFFGVALIAFGGFAAVTPSKTYTFLQNAVMSLALCFAPGGVLTLLGGFLYWREYRLGAVARQQARIAAFQVGKAFQTRAEKLKQAGEYVSGVRRLLAQYKERPYPAWMASLPEKLRLWEANLQRLVERLNTFDTDPILQRDLRETPDKMARLRRELETESDPAVRAQIEETLREVEEYHNHLSSLVNLMRRTELEVDESLATMGSIYSQVQLLSASTLQSSRARRLSEDIDEQTNRLNDLLSAMQEVYGASGQTSG
ncbi:MAG: hypothetical protein D6796_07660 [Caldilineae bacterium]|nr:MAG: hypothetical protein D6796_07660 [Caldilineae bacterium]